MIALTNGESYYDSPYLKAKKMIGMNKSTSQDSKAHYKCCLCGSDLPEDKFFKSNSPLYKGSGHLPICKDCFRQQVQRYVVQYGDLKKALLRMCAAYDIYYKESIIGDQTDVNAAVSGYIQRLNLGQYKKKTFDNTIEEGIFKSELPKGAGPVENLFEDDRTIKERLVDKWGEGLNFPDYQELEKHYKYLKSANPNCDSNQEIFIIDLCYIKMQQLRAVRDGDADTYKKMADAYRQSFQQAGLKSNRENNSNEEFTVGVTCEDIEKYTPAEFYKNKKLYKDFDGLGDYFTRNVFRPLKNLMFGSKDKDPEYYVKDEADVYDED